MKKLLTLLLGLGLALCLSVAAWADYDYIDRYDVTVTPNTDDGSLNMTVSLEWTALESLPYGQELKIGIPNGSIREETALTDNIERLEYDNSYMYVYLRQAYDDGETFTFAFSWVQEYMYALDGGAVSYDYTPGWFDEAKIGEMTLTWNDPAGVTGDFGSTSNAVGDVTVTDTGMVISARDLGYGETMTAAVRYAAWPTVLDQAYSIDNMPADYNGGYYDDYDDAYGYDDGSGLLVVLAVFVVIIFLVVLWASSGDGYRGGFGTHYVFVNHLWYPAGPDGRPRPGSVGTPHRPKPPTNNRGGGFGGGSRGGGFGGGGFGGGGHCACASSCACACACACAGGGRAGCSAKNLYGAVKLSREVTERLQ